VTAGRLYPVALAGGLIAGFLGLVVLVAAVQVVDEAARGSSSCAGGPTTVSTTGLEEIPARLIPVYQQAAGAYGLGPDGWAWLAAVNRIETDFGRDTATSSAGAVGWMQFEPATWTEYGVDGDGDGRTDPYDPADAIGAAARYLRALGAPTDWQRAIRSYNGGPANAGSPSTLGYWETAARDAAAYLGRGGSSPATVSLPASACEPCPASSFPAVPDPLAAYDPVGVPDARGGDGFTPAPGAVYAVGQEPEIARRLDALGRALGLRLTGISGYRTPAHSRAVGGGADDPHTRGQASDTPGVEAVPEGTLERFGLTRPFDALLPGGGHTDPAEADHIQLLEPPAAGSAAPIASLPAGACAAGGAVPLAPGDRARIEPDGRAAAPAGAPPEVRAMIAAGNQLIGTPYIYGGGHADFRPAAGYDCSSAVSWALHGAGYLNAPEDSVTLEAFGGPGAGLWVTVYANPVHAFVYVAGIRLDTSPQAGDGRFGQLGPRWRPATRSTAGFVARHPPGL
jgi:hypothetical protein